MATQNKHWISEHLKEKRVKIPLLILLYFFIGFCLFLFVKAFMGYPVKFLGIEMNQPTPKTDTIYKERVKTDSVYLPDKKKPDSKKVNHKGKV